METKIKLLWILFGLVATGVGLYPISYAFLDPKTTGLLSAKTRELVTNAAYLIVFYLHISLGGIALLTGWSQFISSWRNKHFKFHRFLGYVYVISVLGSSIPGFIIAISSSGGILGAVGFGTLAVLWFISNLVGFINVKRGIIKEHQKWMIRNYALTFSAVTLRIYLSLVIASGSDIVLALQIISWLCWVPNVIVMEIYIQSRFQKRPLESTDSEKIALKWENR